MMATQTTSADSWMHAESSKTRRSSDCSCPPPEYELANLASASSSTTGSLPDYESQADGASSSSADITKFYPTKSLQIEARGHAPLRAPFCVATDPMPIFEVKHDGRIGDIAFQSIRPKRHSGDSMLIRGGEAGFDQAPICTTTYRFGPGRPPRLMLHGMGNAEEEFEFSSKGVFTRSQAIRTHLGTLEWRYASRQERKAIGADSLLILELVSKVALVGGSQEERKKKVAYFVRNEEYRSQGTSRMTAGNGGRLMMDLREWADSKGEAEQMEVLVIATCLTMLKKEVDRRRAAQFSAMAGAAGH